MSDCWFMPETVADQRAENRLSPNQPSDYETLAAIGVHYQQFDPKAVRDSIDDFIKPLLARLGYQCHDVITLSPEVLGEEKFESLAVTHFQEHLHEDDEVRLVVEGSGFFDLRSAQDEWIRVESRPGDCIVVPAGIYHRFTTDAAKYIKTIRLFKENPKWIAVARESGEGDRTEARREYLAAIQGPVQTAVGPAAEGRGVFAITRPDGFEAQMGAIVVRLARRVALSRKNSGDGKPAAPRKDSEAGALMVYVTGAASPFARGESWCPDCVIAKPHVRESLALLKEKRFPATAGGSVFFAEATALRAAYIGNPAYPYRTHEFLQVKGVPTVFVLTFKDDGAVDEALENEGKALTGADKSGGAAGRKWFELFNVRARCEDPTVEALTAF